MKGVTYYIWYLYLKNVVIFIYRKLEHEAVFSSSSTIARLICKVQWFKVQTNTTFLCIHVPRTGISDMTQPYMVARYSVGKRLGDTHMHSWWPWKRPLCMAKVRPFFPHDLQKRNPLPNQLTLLYWSDTKRGSSPLQNTVDWKCKIQMIFML